MKKNEKFKVLTDIISSDRGSFAVLFAITLMVMISVMAFALDLGYFTKVKSNYQACADAAALSAAENLCYGRAVESAEFVAYGSDVLLPDDSVKVEFGFYDSYDEHKSFKIYQDFIQEEDEDYPGSEANNAVLVTIENKVQALTGLNKEKTIKAAAVAYIPRVSIVAGGTFANHTNDSGRGKSTFNNGNIFSGKLMTLYGPRLGTNTKVASDELINIIKKEAGSVFWNKQTSIIKKSDKLPEMEIIKNHILVDSQKNLEEYIEKMKHIADFSYPREDGEKNHYYKTNGSRFYFDLTGEHQDHQIIFFDNEGYGNGSVEIDASKHEPDGSSIKNITFIANCSINIRKIAPSKEPKPLGGKDSEQVTFVSSDTITFQQGNIPYRGVNFYCKTVYMPQTTASKHWKNTNQETDINIRGIATEDIQMASDVYGKKAKFNFKFAPPCPPVGPATLGRLIPMPAN